MRKGPRDGGGGREIYGRAKRSAVQLGRAVSWRRGCSVSSAPNDAKMTLSDAKWRASEEDEKEDEE